MSRFLKFLVLSSFVFLITFVCISFKKYQTGGFRISKLMKANEEHPFPRNISSYEIQKIFSQPFIYLDRGTQFYVFESKDQKYVLKLLRQDRLTTSFLDRLFVTPNKQKQMKQKKQKANQFKEACQLALEILPNETGMIFLHLKTTQNLPFVRLSDRFNFKQIIDVNKYCFIVQKKGVLIKNVMKNANQKKDLNLAKTTIISFFKTISNRAKKKISNTDPNLFENFAMIDGAVIEIDVGDFFFNPQLKSNVKTYRHEINRHAYRFRKWINKYWPELLEFFDQKHQEVLNQ